MRVESGRSWIPVSPEVKNLITARWNLQKSKIPELFAWVTENYPGCNVSSSNGSKNGEDPSITLSGPWSRWEFIMNGSLKEVSDRSKIKVSFRGQRPVVEVEKAHKIKLGGEEFGGGAKRKNVKQTVMESGKPLVQIVEWSIEQLRLINPDSQEFDVSELREKAHELSNF